MEEAQLQQIYMHTSNTICGGYFRIYSCNVRNRLKIWWKCLLREDSENTNVFSTLLIFHTSPGIHLKPDPVVCDPNGNAWQAHYFCPSFMYPALVRQFTVLPAVLCGTSMWKVLNLTCHINSRYSKSSFKKKKKNMCTFMAFNTFACLSCRIPPEFPKLKRNIF